LKQCVVFRAAAGPRTGFGHLVRSQRLSKALGIPAVVALDAGSRAVNAASVLGCRIVAGARTSLLRTLAPSLLVVDHPTPHAASAWIREARKLGIPTASIHDLGIAPCDSDVSVDGTIAPGPMDLAGVKYAIIDPELRRVRKSRRPQTPPVVLIAFGGGHRKPLARAIARAIVAQRPDVEVRIACGFGAIETRPAERGITLVSQRTSLAQEYRNATVAVLAGGVSIYEACSVGLPAIGLAVVQAQRPTIAGLARCGAIVNGGSAPAQLAPTAKRVARLVRELIDDPGRRRALARSATRLVDGRGVERVAAALKRLASGVRA
jgi:spore coat polysaccharide biosynthesis predicted glycosyltransferase SpsG